MKTFLFTFAIFLSLFLLNFQSFGQPQEHSFRWERMSLPTIPEAIIAHGNNLYAFTKNEIFRSVDSGNTWSPSYRILDAQFFDYNNSTIIYRTPPKDWQQINEDADSSPWDATILSYNGFITLPGSITQWHGHHGSSEMDEQHLYSAKILNDNTILYSILQTTTYLPPDRPNPITTSSYIDGFILPDGTKIEDQYIGNAIGHVDSFFLRIQDYQLKFVGENGLQTIFSKPIPEIANSKIAICDSSIYRLNKQGITSVSHDLGDTWEIDTADISDFYKYTYSDGLHIVTKSDGIYLSHDFKHFTHFPTLYEGDLGPDKIYVFGNLVIATGQDREKWYKSTDSGLHWNIFTPHGLSTISVQKTKYFQDTLYVISDGELYKQTCKNKFEISRNNRFLLNSQTEIGGDYAFKIGANHHLYRFDVTNQTWVSIDSTYHDGRINGVFQYEDKIYIFGKKLVTSTDGGITRTEIPTSEIISEITDFTIQNGTIIMKVETTIHTNRTYLSTDYGVTWINVFGLDLFTMQENFYSIRNNVLYKYSSPLEAPINTFPLVQLSNEYDRYKFFNAGDFIFCRQYSHSATWEPLGISLFTPNRGDNWIDVSNDFPKWEEYFYAYGYSERYIWGKGFSDVIYNDKYASLYFSTANSGFIRTSVGAYDTTGVIVTQIDSVCVNEAGYTEEGDYRYLHYGDCGKDSLTIVSANYAQDTTIMLCLGTEGIAYHGDLTFEEAGSFEINLPNPNGCDTLGHFEIFEQTHTALPLLESFLCEGDTLFYENHIYTHPGIFLVQIPDTSFCTTTIGKITITGVTLLSQEWTIESDTIIAGVEIHDDTTFIEAIPSIEFGCDSIRISHSVTILTGSDDLTEKRIRVFPNPTTGTVIIEAENIEHVEVFDITGKKISARINGNKIDIHNQPDGYYLLKITLPNTTVVRKILLE